MTYKPITESVRGIYADRVEHVLDLSREQIRAEFDAWLNEELAKAWEVGHFSICSDVDYICDRFHPNPYRNPKK